MLFRSLFDALVDPVVDLLLSRAAIGEMLDEVLVRDVVATAALLALSLSTFLERQSGSTIPTERRVTVPFWDVTVCRYSRTTATSAYFQSVDGRCNAVTVCPNSIAAWAGAGVCVLGHVRCCSNRYTVTLGKPPYRRLAFLACNGSIANRYTVHRKTPDGRVIGAVTVL